MTHQATRPTIATRFSSLAVKITVALGLGYALPVMAAEQSLTGAEIDHVIKAELSRHQIAGQPQINPAEAHHPCPSGINVAPLFNSWKTIKVTCPDDPKWRFLVRVEMDQPHRKPPPEAPKNAQSKLLIKLARSPRWP